MTKEEAINVLNDYDINFERNTAEEIAEAHEIAIKAIRTIPSEDYISRQAAIDYCRQLINVEHQQGSDEMNYGQERVNQTETILHHLEIIPSVQPKTGQPKTGHWVSHSEYCKMNNLIPSGLGCYFWCSECNCGIDYKYFHLANYKYCPQCGAKMEVDK
jgi:hypothetical protein